MVECKEDHCRALATLRRTDFTVVVSNPRTLKAFSSSGFARNNQAVVTEVGYCEMESSMVSAFEAEMNL
jgi:hypothetical protein